MSKEIWNLGRVCGFSAYELYLRYIAIEAPEVTPATEKEWLSSMLTMGNSMLLRIGTDNVSGVHYRDIPLPVDSKICASNTIFASYFAGSGAVSSAASDYTGFATRVTDYGPLIENTTSSHPSGSTVPPTSTDTGDLTPEMKTQIPEYLKIIDGIIIQPGTWSESDLKPPYCDFKPDLTGIPTIRISFKDKVNVPFFVLLTGFSNKFVVQGVSGTDTATGSQSPDDGDFLGPWVFPWAAKIIFSIPPAAADMLVNDTSTIYTRTLPASGTEMSVTDVPIIDMKTYDPATYYSLHFVDSDKPMTISQLSTSGTGGSILATYWLNGYLPCALYGTTYPNGTTGDAFLYPIDTVAPGTVKLFEGDSATTYAEAVISDVPHNTPFFRDDEYVIYQINADVQDVSDRYLPVSEDTTEDFADLYVYNARYLWFYANNPLTAPTQEDLQNVQRINGIQAFTGYVSDKFITDFCVDYDTALAACATVDTGVDVERICDATHIQQSYLNHLASIYDFDHDPVAKSNFKFFFYYTQPTISAQGEEGMFLPIDVRTNRLCVATNGARMMRCEYGANFSTTAVTTEGVAQSSPDVLGAYWDIASAQDTVCSQETNVSGVYVFQNHPVLHNVVKDFELFWKPYTGVPKTPAEYNDQFVQWFSSIPVTDVITDSSLTAMGIHSDYHTLDFQSFLQYASTERDMSQPISSITPSSPPTIKRWYLISATDITAISTQSSWTDNAKTATAVMKASMSIYDFYKMNKLHILEIDSTGVLPTEGADVTESYRNSSYHQWIASGASGTHETKALSLVDDNGALLPTTGAAGKIEAENITWGDLLDSLNRNEAIDLLGDGLKGMKSSGYDYIQLGNGLRLYLSSTEPTGTIPEGSLGIGWGGIKVYTSGAWAAYT